MCFRKLMRFLCRCNSRYDAGRPIVDDVVYDAALAYLPKGEAAIVQRGRRPAAKRKIVEHRNRMHSLDKAWSADDLRAFDEAVRRGIDAPVVYAVEPKLDGVALSLRYNDGRLVSAATRGDGRVGQDVTGHTKRIVGVPSKLPNGVPPVVEIRGECIWPREAFAASRLEPISTGQKRFRDARSGVAALLNGRDPDRLNGAGVTFTAYDMVPTGGLKSGNELIEALATWGFSVIAPRERYRGIEAAIVALSEWQGLRIQLPMNADGVVVKIENLNQRKTIGATAYAPRWAIAFKG